MRKIQHSGRLVSGPNKNLVSGCRVLGVAETQQYLQKLYLTKLLRDGVHCLGKPKRHAPGHVHADGPKTLGLKKDP